jgi:hypothetical protein
MAQYKLHVDKYGSLKRRYVKSFVCMDSCWSLDGLIHVSFVDGSETSLNGRKKILFLLVIDAISPVGNFVIIFWPLFSRP